jgi:response regulator RpfG family c-di-GMP phosphodiesterase
VQGNRAASLARVSTSIRRQDRKVWPETPKEVGMRLLLVDDDDAFRALLRTTFEAVDVDVDEASNAFEAQERIAAARPDAIVMDVVMPGLDGTALCALLKAAPRTRDIPVVLLTGSDVATEATARGVGADALLLKPFSPLELLAVVERVAAGLHATPFRATSKRRPDEQLLLYARDLRHLLEVERGQRRLLENAYHETVTALASALESKDHGTGEHSQRVHRYAVELAKMAAPEVVEDESVAYGFMLHDVGKIGIPDRILQKAGPLTSTERRLMETHTVLGEQLLRGVSFLRGSGLEVVRSHHERWDGRGYPDGSSGPEIPAAARVFAVADALDAMTSDRPYRRAMSWAAAGRELELQSGRQFDPAVVDAFRSRERSLRRIRRQLDEAALVA